LPLRISILDIADSVVPFVVLVGVLKEKLALSAPDGSGVAFTSVTAAGLEVSADSMNRESI